MGRPPFNYRNTTTYTEADRGSTRFAQATLTMVGTGTVTGASAPIRCQTNEVALIDEIVITARVNDAATNVSCSLMVDGALTGDGTDSKECKIHFPGEADATGFAHTQRVMLQPKGNWVVNPGKTFWVKSNTASVMGCHIKYRHKLLTQALNDGDIRPAGTMPAVASTNSVAAGGTAAATAKAIVAADAGYAIEVLGFYLTGHNFNAAADDIRLGFWNGTTGTFTDGTNGKMIFRGWAQAANAVFAPRVLVDDTRGCIQGPVGDGLYIQASANLAGATPPADYVVMYRKVLTTEVASTSGTVGLTPSTRKKWWLYTQATASLTTPVQFFAFDPLTADLTDPSRLHMARIYGHAGSCTAIDAGLGTSAMGLSDNSGNPYSELIPVAGDGDANAASTSFARVGMNLAVRLDLRPSFLAFDLASGTNITNRAQLAWGTFSGSSLTGVEYLKSIV